MSVFASLLVCILIILLIAFMLLGRYTLQTRRSAQQKFTLQQSESSKKLEDAQVQADLLVKKALREAKELASKNGRDFERLQKEKQLEIAKLEEGLRKREESLTLKARACEKKEHEIKAKEAFLNNEFRRSSEQLKQTEANLIESKKALETVAQLTAQEAREQLQKSIEAEAQAAAMKEVQIIEEQAERTSQERARAIIATAIQRIASDFVADATISVISLPNDEMKGRIIGREGRNIRAIEQATGVDVIIDDTPGAIVISCFNPIRREIAKIAMERLVTDGRIHPARIQEIVQKTQAEFDLMIRETGERSAFDCGITGLNSDLTMALGRLKYMTTGGQSILQHCIETAQIAAMLAHELKLDAKLAQRAALFHDIGKSLNETTEGHHANVGAEFLKRMGESAEVVEAAAKHHDETMQNVFPTTVLVQAANMLSQFRPGARKEFVQRAIERLRDIETAVETYAGVEQAYVIKSGHEVRAMILPSVHNDSTVATLAKTIAKRLRHESNQQHGHVKVTLIREQRATHVAK